MIPRADNNAERQASLKAHREKHGLTLVRVWVAASEAEKVRGYARRLPETRERLWRAKR